MYFKDSYFKKGDTLTVNGQQLVVLSAPGFTVWRAILRIITFKKYKFPDYYKVKLVK